MPHKTWAIGEEVIAVDFNPNIADQVVATFASAAARTAGWPAPPEGAVSRLADTKALEVFTSGVWTRPGNLAGGEIGYADTSALANQTFSAPGDITGLLITWTPSPTRRYRTTVHLVSEASTGPYTNQPGIYDAANVLKRQVRVTHHGAGYSLAYDMVLRETGLAAVATTRKARHVTAAASINYRGGVSVPGEFCSILVEDIGGV